MKGYSSRDPKAGKRVSIAVTAKNSSAYRIQFVELVAKSRLPAVYVSTNWVESGGLMSYGPDRIAMYRRAATYVDKILKGTKPADLPVEQPDEVRAGD